MSDRRTHIERFLQIGGRIREIGRRGSRVLDAPATSSDPSTVYPRWLDAEGFEQTRHFAIQNKCRLLLRRIWSPTIAGDASTGSFSSFVERILNSRPRSSTSVLPLRPT